MDDIVVEPISQNTHVLSASEITETINDAVGNEAASGRETPSVVVTHGKQNRMLGDIEDKVKPRPTDPPPGVTTSGGEFRSANGVANFS